MSKDKKVKNACAVCGKEVKWGMNGNPIMKKDFNDMFILTNIIGWKHFNCQNNSILKKEKV